MEYVPAAGENVGVAAVPVVIRYVAKAVSLDVQPDFQPLTFSVSDFGTLIVPYTTASNTVGSTPVVV